MKALVTGASGFIGKHLCGYLVDKSIEVIPISHDLLRFPQSLEVRIKEINPDYIFHLSAYGNMSNQKDEAEMIQANVVSLHNLLQATKDIDYKAFVNVSSSSVLLDHETMYSATKAACERLCKAYVDEYHKPIVTVRPASIYGPHEADFRFIPTAFRSCLKGEPMVLDSLATHDWTYVSDLVELLVRSAEKIDFIKGKVINCGTGLTLQNVNIIHQIELLTGKKSNITEEKHMRTFDTENWEIDTYPYKALFGGAKVNYKEGLQKCYETIQEEAKM